MSNVKQSEAVQQWLDSAAGAMSGSAASRRDAVLELESAILEQIDEQVAGDTATDVLVHDILQRMGDPEEVGGSMLPGMPLIPAHQTRQFFFHVGVMFAVHFFLTVGATLAGNAIGVPPLRIAPIENPQDLLELLGHALETLVLDAGLVLLGSVLLRRVGRILKFPRRELRVHTSPRRCIEIAVFLGLVLIVVNFLRDNLLAMYVPHGEGVAQVPLVGPGIAENLLWFNVWIGLAIAREIAYAVWRERRFTLGLDMIAGAAGLFCLLRVVATKRLVDLSGARDSLGAAADSVGGLLNLVFVVLSLFTAAMIAARTVQRAYRFALIRR